MAKYSTAAQKSIKRALHRLKKDSLISDSGAKVKSRKQAIAIGLSEAREKEVKIPVRKKAVKIKEQKNPREDPNAPLRQRKKE